MKLEIWQGESKQGYHYTILNEKGEAVASGYYRKEKEAKYWGEKAFAIYQKVSATA